MNLETLLQAVTPLSVKGSPKHDIRGLSGDSRMVRERHLFVAIPGAHHDGWTFVPDAVQRGAVAIVSEHANGGHANVCVIQVADAREAAADLACAYYQHPSAKLKCIGVTGTNGKTTVAHMCCAILEAAGLLPGMLGTVSYRVRERTIRAGRTTPEAIELNALLSDMVHAGCRSVAMEVSSHAVVQKRVRGLSFDAAIFTNLTGDHLDFHRTMEAYYEAKAGYMRTVHAGGKGCAVVNVDDAWGAKLAHELEGAPAGRLLTFGRAAGAAVRAVNVQLGAAGSRSRLVTPWGDADLDLRLLGKFNVQNALAAAAACGSLGIEPRLIAQALSAVTSIPGRLEEIPTGLGFQVFVDYAHTHDALKHVLEAAREVTRGRIVLLFGCGGDRDTTKRPLMGRVAAQLADHTVLTSDNPRSEDPAAIIEQIRAGFGDGGSLDVCENRRDAIARALGLARPGDIVLIAGKGHENFQETRSKVVPFDDRETARDILQSMGGRGADE